MSLILLPHLILFCGFDGAGKDFPMARLKPCP